MYIRYCSISRYLDSQDTLYPREWEFSLNLDSGHNCGISLHHLAIRDLVFKVVYPPSNCLSKEKNIQYANIIENIYLPIMMQALITCFERKIKERPNHYFTPRDIKYFLSMLTEPNTFPNSDNHTKQPQTEEYLNFFAIPILSITAEAKKGTTIKELGKLTICYGKFNITTPNN